MSRHFKRCLITGITGSGGSYLAEHIISKNLKTKIHGFYRSKGYLELLKKNHKNKINFFKVDLTNYKNTLDGIKKSKPDLIFHLASNADVRGSFDNPLDIVKNNNIITANLLEALRKLNLKPLIIICSTSEVYGNVKKKKNANYRKTRNCTNQSIRSYKNFSRFAVTSLLKSLQI